MGVFVWSFIAVRYSCGMIWSKICSRVSKYYGDYKMISRSSPPQRNDHPCCIASEFFLKKLLTCCIFLCCCPLYLFPDRTCVVTGTRKRTLVFFEVVNNFWSLSSPPSFWVPPCSAEDESIFNDKFKFLDFQRFWYTSGCNYLWILCIVIA